MVNATADIKDFTHIKLNGKNEIFVFAESQIINATIYLTSAYVR